MIIEKRIIQGSVAEIYLDTKILLIKIMSAFKKKNSKQLNSDKFEMTKSWLSPKE